MSKPTGNIILFENVPINASYEHTFDFKDAREQYNYWLRYQKHTLTNYTYIRREREYINVGLSISQVDNVNYMCFRGEEDGRLYYAFVTFKRYINKDLTELQFSIDVMQTYQFDYEWRASYIKQAHVDRWTADHKPIYSKTDEGLAYGTEYVVERAHVIRQSDKIKWFLVAMKDYSALVAEGYNVDFTRAKPAPSAFSFFLVPCILEGTRILLTGQNDALYNGIADINGLMSAMHNSAIGDYVQSIVQLPYNPFIGTESESDGVITITMRDDIEWGITVLQGSELTYIALRNIGTEQWQRVLARAEWDIGFADSLPTTAQWDEIKKNPYTTKRDKRFESKLLCSPYRYNVLTDWRSEPVIFKNEYMTADTIEINFAYALSHNAPFRYWIKDYKKDPYGRYTCLSQPVAPEMPIISDQYYTYMLQNRNTIQTNVTNATISATYGAVSGALNGAVSGGVGGAVMAGVNGITSGVVNVGNLIRSENAKQMDIGTRPSIVVNSTDSTFNINDKNTEISFYSMRICCENEEILSEIFNISGYKVHRVEIPNTRTRTRFNFIQTSGANIIGSINQIDLLKIKQIYDNGITIWHYNESAFNPFDYSYENIEVNLI